MSLSVTWMVGWRALIASGGVTGTLDEGPFTLRETTAGWRNGLTGCDAHHKVLPCEWSNLCTATGCRQPLREELCTERFLVDKLNSALAAVEASNILGC